jgi:hypothetical protein
VTVDVCQGGCGGIWFDAFELSRVDESEDVSGELLLSVAADPYVHVDPLRKRECPRCEGVKLKRRFFSPKRRVEIDECPGCAGIWLDAGELERIRNEVEETRFLQEAEAHKPRLTMSVIRYLYQARLSGGGES